jgi:UDP-N-acetylglucosamine transferase subunit ALG13
MVLVVVGTHHQPFDRLLRAVDALADGLGEEVRVQRGASRLALPRCTVHDHVPAATLAGWVVDARRIVAHAGSSFFLECRAAGRTPILVPRRRIHGEHVDDHQVEFAGSLDPGAARICEPQELGEALRTWVEPRHPPGDGSAAFSARLEALVDDLVDRSPRRSRRG